MALTHAERQRRYRDRHYDGRGRRPTGVDRRRAVVNIDDLAVECWCTAEVVFVPSAMIRGGETLSCGAVRCGPEVAS